MIQNKIILLTTLNICPVLMSGAYGENEIKEYQGKHLSKFDREHDNSIKVPQPG